MAWGTAANFAARSTRRGRRTRCSRAWNAFSRAAPARGRAQPMIELSPLVSKQRSERRISVRLPLQIRGRDSRGVIFEEETSSENLCRNGAAFLTRFDVAIGCDLEILIPTPRYTPKRNDPDFATQGRVVHVAESHAEGERIVGVQFIGPRFRRLFRSESVA